MSGILREVIGLLHQSCGFAAECGRGKLLVQHDLIDLLQLGQCKIFRHQMDGKIRKFKFSPKAFQAIGGNAGMIECEALIFQNLALSE